MRAGLNRVAAPACLQVLALLTSFIAGAAFAQTITGTVSANGAPLAGVTVLVETNGRRFDEKTTDAKGGYSVDLSKAGPVRDVQLTFTRTGFQSMSRLLTESALARPLDVSLVAAAGPASLTPDEQAKLKALIQQGGQGPLLFARYRLPAGVAGTGDELNERLRRQLERMIRTHVQTAITEGDTRNVALATLPLPSGDLLRLRAMGEFVNALAVVSGEGFREGAPAAEQLALESQYLIIPRTASFDPPVLSIADTVPEQSIGRLALDSKLSRLWGRATVLALAARDVQAAERMTDRMLRTAELKRVQRYLVNERSNVGANDVLGDTKLKQLLDLIALELAR